jgi:hypothetical protein
MPSAAGPVQAKSMQTQRRLWHTRKPVSIIFSCMRARPRKQPRAFANAVGTQARRPLPVSLRHASVLAHTRCIYKCVAHCACVRVHVCVCVCVCLCLRARVVYAQVLSEGQAFGAVNFLALGPHSAGGQDRGHERDKVEMVMEGRITRRRWV